MKGGNPKVVAALTAPKFSEKAQRAMESRVPCKAEKQRIADEQERIISQGVGLPRTPDNAAFDLRGPKVGVEIKTMIDSKNGKVTVSGKAFARKEAEAAGPPRLKTFLVVADKRGGGTKYYIADHIGSLRVNSMTPTTIAGIRSMVR